MPNPVTLHFTEQGQGTPVVLLHGYPLSSVIWHEQVESLSSEYHVITPDLRGHGQSPAPEGVYDMDLMARDVFALLDSLDVQKAVIMGHSMGGYITLAAHRLAPERFLALGLIGSQAGADSEETRQNRYKTAEKVFMDGSSVVANTMITKLFAPGFPMDDPIADQVKNIMLNIRPSGIIGSLKGMAARPDSGPTLPNVNVPVLIITGDKDQIIAPTKAEAMASAIPGATLATVENAGHLMMMEQPQATAMAIRNFLSTMND